MMIADAPAIDGRFDLPYRGDMAQGWQMDVHEMAADVTANMAMTVGPHGPAR